MNKSIFLVLLFTMAAFGGTAADADIIVTAAPETVYIETAVDGQHLNFDFVIENRTNKKISISAVELSVYDQNGKLELRKFIDGNGTSPSILTIAKRDVEPAKKILLFNPFHTFAAEIKLGRLAYKFEFERDGNKSPATGELSVTPRAFRPKTALDLPLRNRMIVYDGHDFYAHHRRFDFLFEPIAAFGIKSNFMRYSYDFCPVNSNGEMFKGDREVNASWFGFGASVFAAGGGVIAEAVDKYPDNRSFDEKDLVKDPMVLFGNYIVIDHENGEFSLFAHLQHGSLAVRRGERVTQGKQIARIGASGSANFPHLHYELRTGPGIASEGLPSYFHRFTRILGSTVRHVQFGGIDSGDIIQSRQRSKN